MLILEKINKTFDLKPVLKDINLSVGSAELIQLNGSNGSGKTTLLKIIAGLLKAESGEAVIFKENIFSMNNDYKKYLIYWGHQPMIYPHMTTLENLILFLKLRNQSIPENIDLLLEHVGLIDYKNIQCYKYSQGMFQIFNLLRCVVSEWKLALMDEPISGLDSRGVDLLINYIKDWQENKRSIIITSHDNSYLNSLVTSSYTINNNILSKENV